MNEAVVVAVVGILPQLILVALAVAVVARFRDPIGRFVDSRVSSVTAFGLKVDLRSSEVDSAVASRLEETGASESIARDVGAAGAAVVARAERLAPRLIGRTVLWVDDHPEWNRVERRLLRQMGIHTEAVVSNRTAESVSMIRQTRSRS